jgi:hypothetical protein
MMGLYHIRLSKIKLDTGYLMAYYGARRDEMKNKQTVLAKIIAFKFDYDDETAALVAEDMIADDFVLNKIKTMGEAIAYLDFVHDELRG